MGDNELIKISSNYLFNNCLAHNNTFIFYCQECKISLCLNCDIASHNDKGHILQQIISLRKNQKNKDRFKIIINKQKILLNKIKDMYIKIIQSLENDIIIKEKIFDKYENNFYNYHSIQNFNDFELNHNEKYEKFLDEILNKIKIFEKKQNNENSEEIFINAMISPLYYSIMINDNLNYINKINNILNKKLMNICKELNVDKVKNKYLNITDFFDKNEDLNTNNNSELFKKKNNEDNIIFNKENNQKKEKENIIKEKSNNNVTNFNSIEIKTRKQEKKILNMIFLHTGNIATSSIGAVTIYNSKNLLSPYEKDYLLQTINFSKDKKISYVFEFPDETLLCSTYERIFRLKLINNDKNFNILGIIDLNKFELPLKLISLGDSILSALTIINRKSFIRLFIKAKELKDNKIFQRNYVNDNLEQIDNNENYDSDNQSAGILSDYFDCLDKKEIKKDKDFYPFSNNNNLNEDEKLLCSIYEIKNNNK